MKAGWEVKPLGDLCKFVRGPFGGSLKKDIFVQEGYAVYEQQHAIYNQFNQIRYFIDKNKFTEMSRFVLNSGDLIMSCSGTMGKVAIVPENIKAGIINQALLKLTPSKLLLPKFLKYWMDSKSFQDGLREQSGGAAIQNVASVAILKEIKLPHPNPVEQERIVAILDQAFEGIAKARANAEQNLQNARALFESQLQSVFTQRGEGWIEKTLSEACEIKPPKSEAKKLLNDSELVSFAPMEDLGINQKYLLPNKQRALRDVAGSYTYFAENDVLLAKITPCFENGKLGIAKSLKNGIGFGSSEYIVFRPIKELSNEFLYYFLSRKRFFEEGAQRMTGAVGHKRVSKEFIEGYKIAFPSLEIQAEIVTKLDALQKETKRLEALYQRKIAYLDELKKSLLQQAFAGEL